MSTQLLETAEALDLSDLDLLGSPYKHLFCAGCQPEGPGIRVALCGEEAFSHGTPVTGNAFPPGFCGGCVKLFHRPCPRCV